MHYINAAIICTHTKKVNPYLIPGFVGRYCALSYASVCFNYFYYFATKTEGFWCKTLMRESSSHCKNTPVCLHVFMAAMNHLEIGLYMLIPSVVLLIDVNRVGLRPLRCSFCHSSCDLGGLL